MSTGTARKHKTTFKKKKNTVKVDYWGDETAEPSYTPEQKKRIESYLTDNDENCKESTTLILLIVIGLLVALSIVGFLAIRNNPSIKYKGAHTIYEHDDNTTIMDIMWGKWTWIQNELFGASLNGTNMTADATEIQAIVALEEELNDFQPIYRNPLLQTLYADTNDDECFEASDDSVFQFLTIKHGAWIPSQQYLTEAVDFSWADFQTQQETEEMELEQIVDEKDMTEDEKARMKRMKDLVQVARQKRHEPPQKQDPKTQTSRRRLLANNKMFGGFDPLRALPNPANVILPHSKGDKGAGDVEADILSKVKEQMTPEGVKNALKQGVVPPWVQNRGVFRNHDFSQSIRDRLPFGNKKRLDHLDAIQRENRGKGVSMRNPEDVLKALDLQRFGIQTPVTPGTSDKEKKQDLKILEQSEARRHPYMTLLTNPGGMSDVSCVKNNYRMHEVSFKRFAADDVASTVEHGGTDADGKHSVFSYDNNVRMWYCYLVEIDGDALQSMEHGAFKVNLTLYDVDLEVAHDYVEIYINSQLVDAVSGIGRNWATPSEAEVRPQFVYYLDDAYVQSNGYAMEVCMKIVTDASVIRGGFKSMLSVTLDDPTVTQWSEWSACATLPVRNSKGNKNDRHWNGKCGVGVRSKSVLECHAETNQTMETTTGGAPATQCVVGESLKEYCIVAPCFDFPMDIDAQHPEKTFLFNGHGRIDPDFADPYLIQRSTQDSFNLSLIMDELESVRQQIVARYPDERALASAVINHYYMDQSRLRLGIRLARSLLLGDAFTVYTTGSSNTAGHENQFMSTWPIQFQSIMRPTWKRLGYKGAAFVVKNHAEGGAVSSMQLSWCIPSLVGDDADVVFWESQMNDHGAAKGRATENHFRNAITLPRRPLYHVMHAGKNAAEANEYDAANDEENLSKGFKNENLCYGWVCGGNPNNVDYPDGVLLRPYTEYGAGVTLFYPQHGLMAINTTRYEEFAVKYLYVSWHPGPTGHRVYAEMLAYHYLTAVLDVFADIQGLIASLTPNDGQLHKPIEEMLEILEDPPTKPLPPDASAGHCDPFCTNATESYCISGYETLGKPQHSLQRWREKQDATQDSGKWQYNAWFLNPQAFSLKEGGQASSDNKFQWTTRSKDATDLKFRFEAKQYGIISIESNNIFELTQNGKVQLVINEIDVHSTDAVNDVNNKLGTFAKAGKPLKCDDGMSDKNKYWQAGEVGCSVQGLKPYQKYEIVFSVTDNVEFGVKNLRVY